MNIKKFNINSLKTGIGNKINSNKKFNIINYLAAIVVTIFVATALIYFITEDSRTEKLNASHISKGQEFLYSGEVDNAIKEYESIIADNEKDSKLSALRNIYIADAYSQKGDLENYKKYIGQAKNIKSNDDEVLNKLVFSQYINGDIASALKEGEVALNGNPNNKQLIKTMIGVYMGGNKKDAAIKLKDSYIVDKSSAYDIAEYSKIVMTLGDFNKGLNVLKEAWTVDQDELKIYDVLAQMSLYNKDKLVSEIKEIQKTNPEDPSYKMWLAKIYSLSKETSGESQKLVSELKSKNGNSLEIKLIELNNLNNLSKDDEVNKLANELLNKNSEDYRVFHTVGWISLKKGNLEEAMEFCKRSIELNESYPDNYAYLMPEILKRMEKSPSAAAYYWTGIFKEPYNYNTMISAANYYWYVEQNADKSLQHFKMASAIKPEEPEIKYNIALLYFNEQKDDEAIKTLKEIIKQKPTSIKYHRTLGTVYLTMGKSKEGMDEIRAAFKYDENDILTLNNAGCYYIMFTNDFNRANTNLKKAFEGINESTDEYTRKIIKENYDNIKAIIQKIQKGKSNESITIPDFRLLY